MLKKIVYVLPEQIANLFVSLNDDRSVSVADYQWLTVIVFKAGVCYFLSNFYFSPNDSPSETMTNIFYFI